MWLKKHLSIEDVMPDSDTELFKRAVQGVTPLSVERRAVLHRPRPMPLRRAHGETLPPVAAAALSDDFEPAVLADTEGSMFHRPPIQCDVICKLQRGAWPVQAQLDLHHMRRCEARDALYHFLQRAVQRGYRCVRVIHGKGWGSPNGRSILKEKVRIWLVQTEDVMAFCPARPQQGGEGAAMVLLRSSASRQSAR
jgi:DNA-nicking Smr family endonuclease